MEHSDPEHGNPLQDCVSGVEQLPEPLQPRLETVPPEQLGVPQTVEELGKLHEALWPLQEPAQLPVPPHDLPAGGKPDTKLHDPKVQLSQGPLHALPVFCQVPVPSQVWGCVLLPHCFSPGRQEPAQLPPVHTYGHAAPVFCQAPVASQVCGCSRLHCFWVGEQEPVHAPLVQT
jgi:hypothetical protein